jgi:calcineurin-like phosphoesterase family protein
MPEIWFTHNERYGEQGTEPLPGQTKLPTAQYRDDFLIEQHNSVVGPEDAVLHIGGFGQPTLANATILDRLNGVQHIYFRVLMDSDASAYLNIGFHVVHNGVFGSVLENLQLKNASLRNLYLKNASLRIAIERNRFESTCLSASRRTPDAATLCLFMLPLNVNLNNYKPVSLSYVVERSEEMYQKTVQDALDEALKKLGDDICPLPSTRTRFWR